MKNRLITNSIAIGGQFGRLFLVVIAILLFSGCFQSDPKPFSFNTAEFGRVGDSIRFSGYDWKIKVFETAKWGPGPNYFSGHERDVTIDENGYLHLKIVQRNSKWMSTEVFNTQYMGYGTYTFTTEGNLDQLPANVVFGLFTFDFSSFQQEANSEVDIEFSKWGVDKLNRTTHYAVQPVNFGTYYEERTNAPKYESGIADGVTTHQFEWTDTAVNWSSYTGEVIGEGEKIASWRFGLDNPARTKEENGNTSNPVIIPKPGSETHARINLWLMDNQDIGPRDGLGQEVIVRKFNYEPL